MNGAETHEGEAMGDGPKDQEQEVRERRGCESRPAWRLLIWGGLLQDDGSADASAEGGQPRVSASKSRFKGGQPDQRYATASDHSCLAHASPSLPYARRSGGVDQRPGDRGGGSCYPQRELDGVQASEE